MPPTTSRQQGFLAPAQLAALYREENPGKFDDIDDGDLIRAIEVEDPESFALIDPLLIGAENLPAPKPPVRPAPRLIPPPPMPSTADLIAATGLRVAPAIVGAVAGSSLGPLGTAGGGMLGSGLGEVAAQKYEKTFGPREEYSVPAMVFESALGAFNPVTRAATTLGRIGTQAAYGAGVGAAGGVGRPLIEEGRLPTAPELLTQTLAGGVFGGATHGGIEGYQAIARRAPSFADVTGALPTGPGPVPSAADQLVLARAAAQQYEAEEARLAGELTALFGKDALASGSARADLHTATQAKDYLEQLAQLRATPVPIPPMGPTQWGPEIPPYLNRVIGREPGLLPPASPDFLAYPPGVQPTIDQLGPLGARPGIIANAPPPSPLEEALAASLAQPPGPPRLVRERPYQALTLEAPGVAGMAELAPPRQPGLFRQPPVVFPGRVEAPSVAELGGAPPAFEQPRLPGITSPRPLDRVYAEGPNAGPRRRGEVHGQPRALRRQVETEEGVRYETYPSSRIAEDPGTYPPEVRRELAAMAWELDNFRHETFQGGTTREQIEAMQQELGGDIASAIAEIRRRGASAGGAIAGAPVYHDVIRAAEGGFKHITRADMLDQIRAALLKGKGTGLTDAAAEIARARLAERAQGPLARGSKILAKTGREGDELIGWEDALGERAQRGAPSTYTQAVREMEDGELLAADRIWREAGGDEGINFETVEWFDAARREAVRRGLITPEQLELRMLGPGAEGGPPIKDFEEGPPPPLPSRRKTAEEEGPPPPDRIARLIQQGLGENLPPPDYGVPLFGRPPEPPPPPPKEPRRLPPEFLPVERETGDVPIPGLEKVRMEERLTPTLEAPPARPPAPPAPEPEGVQGTLFGQPSLWERFLDERGVLILDVPAGDRSGLKRWMKRQEEAHGGEAWYARVEQAMEDGDWDRAWKTAAAQSARSYTKAFAAAKTPQEEAALRAAVRGTPLQQDLPAQIIAVGRAGQQKRPAPKVEGMPPSYKVTTRQMGKGMTLGPAGLIQPGPPTMPPPRKGRAVTLDREIMDTFVEELADAPELIHLVRGNRDAALRLGRQVTDLVVQGQVKFDPADFPGLPREEVGRQYMHTLSEAGRILGAHGRYVQEYADELYEMADRMDMGAALAGTLGGRRAPMGARGRVSSKAAAEALDRVAQRTAVPQVTQNLLLNDLQRPPKRSTGDKLMDSQYASLTSGFATAARNAFTTIGRYTWELFDHALTVPIAAITGEKATGKMAGALLRERVGARHTGFAVTPLRAAKAETFEELYNLQTGMLAGMSHTDARRTLKILSEYPDEAAHLIGFAGGEQLASEGSGSTILDKLLDPKVQRWLTLWNRAQEFTGRGLTFDTTFRAILRTRGVDPVEALADPSRENLARLLGGDRAVEEALRFASNAALEMTWAGQLANRSIPAALVNFVQSYWPAKLVQRFPRFNFSAAPRWIYDHSPAALLDLVRLPFDAAGWTSTGRVMGGGRLYRGLKAQQYQTDVIPALRGEISTAQGELGTSLLELQSTSREWTVRQRQVARLQARAQQGLPGTQTALDGAIEARDQLARRRDRLKGEIKTHKTTIQDLTAQEERLWKEVQNATGISAPTWSSWMARMTSGTFGLLGAAVVVRSQSGAEGTRFYQYRIEGGAGQDPYMLDLRAAAPFVQYLMVADVLVDFWRHTNWEQAGQDAELAGPTGRGNPLNWTDAIWANYEGKYTRQLLGAEFAQAFLSISRAAGTTLTIADLMTRNGWPGPNEAADAIIGTIGQFLGGYATTLGQFKDIIGEFSPEEAQIRATPRPSTADPSSWSYPLAEGLGRIPLISRLIPPTYSQTTGQPVRGVHPGIRAITGIGGTQADFIQEEVRRVGLPGASVYFRETGDYGLDTLLAQTYARVLQTEMPAVLENPEYQALGTPAAQRDYLQRVFPLLKRAALGEVKELLGLERVEEAMTTGEEARRKRRQAALVERLEGAEPRVEQAPFEEPEPPPPAPAPAAPF